MIDMGELYEQGYTNNCPIIRDYFYGRYHQKKKHQDHHLKLRLSKKV